RQSAVRHHFAGDHEREFERLLIVKPGIDQRFIGARQVLFALSTRTADALSNVLAGKLDVDSPQGLAGSPVDVESVFDLRADVLKVARFDAGRSDVLVAMHWIANPEHPAAFGPDHFDEPRQFRCDPVGAEAVNEREASRLAAWIEDIEPASNV